MTGHGENTQKNSVPLREGFTTGSSATAAAMAAATLLFSGTLPEAVSIPLPPVPLVNGQPASDACARILVPVLRGSLAPDGRSAIAVIRKDGGDDPDATHGMQIYAVVSPYPFNAQTLATWSLKAEELSSAVSLPADITLFAGPGVGRVTLPGLPVPPGEPAVNPEPRKQIAAGLHETAVRHARFERLHCCIFAPDGEKRAQKTLNARLGIMGGISILGTRGIVRPYSHDAWKCAIIQGMDVARSLGCEAICLSTGRRSEKALMKLFPELPAHCYVQAADYAGFSLKEAARHGFSRIIWGCYPGKLLKLAQGLEWTHARSAAMDFSLLEKLCAKARVPQELTLRACAIPTAAGALAFLHEADPAHEAALAAIMAEHALTAMFRMADFQNNTSQSLLLRVFSPESGNVLIALDAAPKKM